MKITIKQENLNLIQKTIINRNEGYKNLYEIAVEYENFINSSKKIQVQYKTWNNRNVR